MIGIIIQKELRDILRTTKFVVTFSICSLLILLTFYIGGKNHQVQTQRYHAARAENLRAMEGLNDWVRANNHRIFLPPRILESLVGGVSNDIGRTVIMAGQGELTAQGSRFGEDPIYATFRFLDLAFIFQAVLSLFAILFAFDAVNGEKERGTLRLTFANAVPRSQYILGKWLGAFVAVIVPLLIPILLGLLLLPIMGISLTGHELLQLGLIILTGLLYFSVFLTLSLFLSVMTHRSSTSFLLSLLVWIFAVLIIPRSAVLLAARSVHVPTIAEISHQKARYRSQLWDEDRGKINQFKPDNSEGSLDMASQFNQYMQNLSDERNKKLSAFSSRLNEERQNRERLRQKWAMGFSRLSPASVFSLAVTHLAETALGIQSHFLKEATRYQNTYADFMREKTGMVLGSGMMIISYTDEEEPEPIDPSELPEFHYQSQPLHEIISGALPDMALLALFNMLFLAGAFVGFLRYDIR